MEPTALTALLQQANAGLRQADEALLAGDLDMMLPALERGLDALCALALQGEVATAERAAPPPWDGQVMAGAVWEVLARLHKAGCHAFPFAGTLLGFERDGQLLTGDKDADFGVWLDDFNLAARAMRAMGLVLADNVPPFGNLVSLIEPRAGLTIDLFGLRREPERQRLVGGTWLYDRPASHQRITVYPWVTLEQRNGPAGPVWWPSAPEALLEAAYGDWRTPQPEWDSVISSRAVQEFNLHWRCFALKNLAASWLTGKLPRTRRLLDQISARVGWDAPLLRYRDALDAVIASTGQGSA